MDVFPALHGTVCWKRLSERKPREMSSFINSQRINEGRSPNLRCITRTHRVDLDWLFERTQGSVHKDAVAVTVTTVANTAAYDSSDVRSFSHEPFSCTAFAVPQTVAQQMWEAEFFYMWNQYFSQLLKSGCILGDCGLCSRNTQPNESGRNPLHVDTSSQILRKTICL